LGSWARVLGCVELASRVGLLSLEPSKFIVVVGRCYRFVGCRILDVGGVVSLSTCVEGLGGCVDLHAGVRLHICSCLDLLSIGRGDCHKLGGKTKE
jgi:hypothetical protein